MGWAATRFHGKVITAESTQEYLFDHRTQINLTFVVRVKNLRRAHTLSGLVEAFSSATVHHFCVTRNWTVLDLSLFTTNVDVYILFFT